MCTVFSENGFNIKAKSAEKYEPIIYAIESIYHACFKNHDLRNYFYHATHNLVKGLGKEKGTLRWVYYKNRLTQILEKYSQLLKDIIETCDSVAWDKIEKLKCFISEQCVKANTMKYEITDNYTFEMCMEKYEESHSFVIDQITELHTLEKFPPYKVNYEAADEPAHLFLFSGNDGYAEVEVMIRSDKTYIIHPIRTLYPNKIIVSNKLLGLLGFGSGLILYA